MSADPAEIRRAVTLICEPGAVHEIRAPATAKGTISGYYSDFGAMARDAERLSNDPRLKASGVYLTINPVNAALSARAQNRLEHYAKHTTADADVVRRCCLLFDFDPVRPSGISSTDAEHDAAIARAREARDFLRELGLPEPIFADSGNGGHLLYRVDLPNDDPFRDLLKRVIEASARMFDDSSVKIDKTTFNAARIWKVYGTVARKGDSTPERPHRLARIIEGPETLSVVTRDQLEEIAAMAPAPTLHARCESAGCADSARRFNLDSFIERHLPGQVKRIDPYRGGRRIILDACVFDQSHRGTSAAIIKGADGSLGYSCLHNGCVDKHWHDVRELFEPRDRQQDTAADANQASPWAEARAVDDFLTANESEAIYLIKDTLARESVTVVASPRGLGKTNVAYWWAIQLSRQGLRGLIIDRDNPKKEIRRRLKAWGAAGLGGSLKVIARDQAPPLTDRAAWGAFPYHDYDFVVLDSISAATEGVEEKDGGKAGAGLAPLLDAARRGPAVLLLANTTKDGLKVRGSGTLSDRADIVFEVRDATDLKVDVKHEVWWEALPESGEHAWSDRAKRRRRRDSYRLALVVSKFRLGEEPNPIVFEVHHDLDPWSVTDVTAEVEQQLEDAKRAAADAAQAKADAAVAALAAALPIAKNPGAIDLLVGLGFGRNAARRLIADRTGRDWILASPGTKKDPYILQPLAGNDASKIPSLPVASSDPIPAGPVPQRWQEMPLKNGSAPRVSEILDSCRSFSVEDREDGVREVEVDIE